MNSQTDEASGAKSQREILDGVLADLQSGDVTHCLAAIRQLGMINFSSEAVVHQLKILAVGDNTAVRNGALEALDLRTSLFVASKLTTLVKSDRNIVLTEIETWRQGGLIESHRAEVLRRQYDFDTRTGIPAKTASVPAEKPVAPVVEAAPSVASMPSPVTPAQPTPTPTITPRPAPQPVPSRSLMEVLLSETSIKIYLYLGAFFVIAAAAILAALVEAARLPVLLVATALFAAGAVGLKKRLPQPSFALAVVFSFLLPIDANVLVDSLTLSPRGNEVYWTVVFLFMAIVWALGTWFYASRLFSVAAFISLILSAFRFSEIFDTTYDWNIFSVALANILGLFAVHFLKKWKDPKFVMPVFLLAQLTQIIVLANSFGSVIIGTLDVGTASGNWIAATLTWLLAASFYIASDLIIPFLFFPWMAVASLFFVPWLTLSTFDPSAPAQIVGFAVWGIVHALGSEFIQRANRPTLAKYHYPLLAWSLPLFFVAVIWGFTEDLWYGFAAFLVAGVTYTIINVLRARWYVWLTALLACLGAYFTFFNLPFMERIDVFYGYRFLGAASLLLIPELFFKEKVSLTRPWNWPLIGLGTFVAVLNLLSTLLIDVSRYGSSAVIMGTYAILFAAYALRFRSPLLGYFGTASTALSILFTLNHFDFNWWLPAFTVLAMIYYVAGFLLARREEKKSWARMLIYSGLALGVILSLVALLTSKETGGWYALVIAVLFITELYTRRNAYFEWFAEALLSIAIIRILSDIHIWQIEYTLLGISLIWLACDAVFQRTLKDRALPNLTRIATGALTLLSIFFICFEGGLTAGATTICFAVYTAFFAAYAWAYREPRLGYLSTASAAMMTLFALDHFHIETWLPVFTGLSAGYYLAGFLLRKQSAAWSQMLRYSGLALGGLLTLNAVSTLEPTGGWYAAFVGGLFVVEMYTSRNGWFEAGVHVFFTAAAFLILHDFKVNETSYNALAFSLIWLIGDMIFERTFKERTLSIPARVIGNLIAGANALLLIGDGRATEAGICFGVYAVFYALYAWFYKKPMIGYASTSALALAVFFGLRAAEQGQWLLPLIAVAVIYYVAGYFLRRADQAKGWDTMLLFSGLGLGTLVALAAPSQYGGLEKTIPIAIAATFYAAEAFARKNVWLGFPANALYLMAYFVILNELKVDEPQFFTVGAAALGLLQHYLLRRAGSKRAAFITGLVSQLVLLGASYIQMIDTGELKYFFLLFFQALVVLVYGIVVRSRSLIIAPIGFAVLAVITVLYNALKDLSLVFIIGVTGIVLLALGILAVVMRERITNLAERFSDWDA